MRTELVRAAREALGKLTNEERASLLRCQAERFLVRWEIDIDADTPEEAAQEAYNVMCDPQSLPPTFEVVERDGKTVLIDIESI